MDLIPLISPAPVFPALFPLEHLQPHDIYKLLVEFSVSALQHTLVAYAPMKVTSAVKCASALPQNSLGENVEHSYIHSLINGAIWYMAEAASCDWFLLARNMLYMKKLPQTKYVSLPQPFPPCDKTRINESQCVSSAESLSIISRHSSREHTA